MVTAPEQIKAGVGRIGRRSPAAAVLAKRGGLGCFCGPPATRDCVPTWSLRAGCSGLGSGAQVSKQPFLWAPYTEPAVGFPSSFYLLYTLTAAASWRRRSQCKQPRVPAVCLPAHQFPGKGFQQLLLLAQGARQLSVLAWGEGVSGAPPCQPIGLNQCSDFLEAIKLDGRTNWEDSGLRIKIYVWA